MSSGLLLAHQRSLGRNSESVTIRLYHYIVMTMKMELAN
jgi:hypothetical protein